MKVNRGITVIATAIVMAVAGRAAAQGTPDMNAGAPVPGEPPASAIPDPGSPPTAQGVPPEVEPAPIPETTPMGTPIYTPVEPGGQQAAEPRWMPASRIGLAILAGGGVTDFTQGTPRSETGVGGSWDVRFAVATRYWVGFEGSYVGGANSIHGLGLSGNSSLVRNGLEGVLRVQVPLYAKDMLLEPYLFGGGGWNGYRVSNVNSFTASVTTNSDNTVTVPLGVGFAIGYKGFMGDLRYTIRPTYQQTIIANQGGTGLTNWDAGAMIGYEF
jgi:hypothetical protein